MPLRHAFDLAEDGRVVDGGRHAPGLAVADLLDGAAKYLARSRQPVIAILWQRRSRRDSFAHPLVRRIIDPPARLELIDVGLAGLT